MSNFTNEVKTRLEALVKMEQIVGLDADAAVRVLEAAVLLDPGFNRGMESALLLDSLDADNVD